MKTRPVATLTVLITLMAWVGISNHCALGAATVQPKMQQEECPFHSKQPAPSKQKSANDSPCCKILRAIPSQTSLTTKIFFVGWIEFPSGVAASIPTMAAPVLLLDTGPPAATSFIELIWSMRAHAPPLSA